MKSKIESLKNNKSSLKDYVKCFCEGKKTNEQFINNKDFQNLKDKVNEKKDF